jgi:hypothetical protein
MCSKCDMCSRALRGALSRDMCARAICVQGSMEVGGHKCSGSGRGLLWIVV